ncbi:MAG: SAP domain-containing protein [archaeon]|nr:SAP domain-containing protein [archaeon]
MDTFDRMDADIGIKPPLDVSMDPDVFLSYYWLKEELVGFCRRNGLSVSGSKAEVTERIHRFFSTGEVVAPSVRKTGRRDGPIAMDVEIGDRFVCTEERRVFFEQHIGKGFRFNVPFQRWLRSHPRSTYAEAIAAYSEVHGDGTIGPQFEYQTYTGDFFADNPGRSLEEATVCWRYRRSLQGTHRYQREDLAALEGSKHRWFS